ncbi:MAG: sulfotransferase domain-containing protein [Rickettsiales bacterium]
MLDFLGIGAQKTGTTWLAEMLSLHPDVAFPAGKEVHFWDDQREKGAEYYKQLFQISNGKKNGEITPSYAFLSKEIISEIHTHFPSVPLFYSVRDPIERAWSGALMALKRAELQFEEASDQWFLDHFYSKGSLSRGDYETCLRNWISVYPAEQILLIRQEEIANHPRQVVIALAEHIGIDPKFFTILSDNVLAQKVFSGEKYPIRPKLREALNDIYKDKIPNFETFLLETKLKRVG